MINKFNFSLFLFILFFSLETNAQDSTTFRIGIETGVNFCNSSEDTSPLKKGHPTLPQIGISVDYSISKYIGFESGLFYSQKGLNSKGDTETIQASVKLHQHTVQIPFIATYKYGFTNSKFIIGIGVGAYYSHGVGGKTKANGIVFGKEISKNLDTFNNILKKNDLGLKFKLLSEYNHLVFNLSYELGLVNIGKSNVLGSNLDYKNRIISMTVGYRFIL